MEKNQSLKFTLLTSQDLCKIDTVFPLNTFLRKGKQYKTGNCTVVQAADTLEDSSKWSTDKKVFLPHTTYQEPKDD